MAVSSSYFVSQCFAMFVSSRETQVEEIIEIAVILFCVEMSDEMNDVIAVWAGSDDITSEKVV